jgi:hypothetical protein
MPITPVRKKRAKIISNGPYEGDGGGESGLAI